MSNNHDLAVQTLRIKGIKNLDELSLYIEVNTFENLIKKLEYEAKTSFVNEIKNQNEINYYKETLSLHIAELTRFGIDPVNTEQVNSWKKSCKEYLNSLDMLEYTQLSYLRRSGQDLNFFCTAEEGKSSFLKQEKEKQKQKLPISKIS